MALLYGANDHLYGDSEFSDGKKEKEERGGSTDAIKGNYKGRYILSKEDHERNAIINLMELKASAPAMQREIERIARRNEK